MYGYPVVSNVRTPATLAGLLGTLADDLWSLPAASSTPRCDVYTDKTNWYVDVELPGVKKANVHVKVEGDVLRVEAERTESEKVFWFLRRERPVGTLVQSFRLGEALDVDKLDASFEDGLLRVSVPLKTSAMGREITVR